MVRRSHDLQDWSDDDLFDEHHDVAPAGLPEQWRHYRWWLAALVFSGLWMLQSWSALGSLPSAECFFHLSLSALSLLLSLGFCWALHQFCKPYSPALSQVLCVLGATALLFQYAG